MFGHVWSTSIVLQKKSSVLSSFSTFLFESQTVPNFMTGFRPLIFGLPNAVQQQQQQQQQQRQQQQQQLLTMSTKNGFRSREKNPSHYHWLSSIERKKPVMSSDSHFELHQTSQSSNNKSTTFNYKRINEPKFSLTVPYDKYKGISVLLQSRILVKFIIM